jgi:RimJ/RimL family protein N-acetyltransferase/catechol 2,3-dioxygenase-like lactoylglutathione lyase family enzyme
VQTLTTERLDLVPLDPDRDAADLHHLLADPGYYHFGTGTGTGDQPTTTLAETREHLVDTLAGNGGATWVIRLRPDPTALGTIGLFPGEDTGIRGLSWGVHPAHWGRGLAGEAARAVVPHLLQQPGITGLEAWIDSRNTRSLGVARSAGLDERGRLPRQYRDHTAVQIVMARAAEPADPDTYCVRPVLPVRDVAATAEELTSVLGLHESLRYGKPPQFVRLGIGPWAGSPGLDLVAADPEPAPIAPATLAMEVGPPVDEIHRRALAAGLKADVEPVDLPWFRREFTFTLPEGHRITVVGALPPSAPES